jgi:FkbM family methyltransferase
MLHSDLRDIFSTYNRSEIEALIRSETRACYIGNGLVLCIVLGKYKFFLDSSDIGFSPHLIFDGYWEFWLTQFMIENIKPADKVLDIGANHGYYSVLMADLVTDLGCVHSFEPNPHIFKLMSNSLSINGFGGRSIPWNYAISNSKVEQLVDFFVPNGEPKNGRFLFENEKVSDFNDLGEVTKVKSRKFNIDEFGGVDFIKIDVEGAEVIVLNSISEMLSMYNPHLVVEVNFSRGYTYEDVLNLTNSETLLHHLDFDGNIKPLTIEQSQVERINDDWLVYSGPLVSS